MALQCTTPRAGSRFGACDACQLSPLARAPGRADAFVPQLPSHRRCDGASSSGRASCSRGSFVPAKAVSSYNTPGSPVPRSSPSTHSSRLHGAAQALFSQASDAIEDGRWSEAAAVLEDALDVHRGFARVPLAQGWSLARLQQTYLECLLHSGQYARCAGYAQRLLTQLPPRDWCRPLWVQGVALALSGQRDAAVDCMVRAFMEGVVPDELRGSMRLSFAAAGAFDGDAGSCGGPGNSSNIVSYAPRPSDSTAGPGPGTAANMGQTTNLEHGPDSSQAEAGGQEVQHLQQQQYHRHNAVAGHEDFVPPRLPQAVYHAAATAAYPWVSTDPCPEELFCPLDAALDGSCSIHGGWYDGAQDDNGLCVEQSEVWSQDMLVRFMLFGDPDASGDV